MRLFLKALLGLVCLVPTLSAAVADTESRFIRIERNANKEPVALQTLTAKYVPTDNAKVEIDLVGVVHFGEEGYYQKLNKEFEKYDVVLYELVGPQGSKPQKGRVPTSDNPLAMLPLAAKFFLRLESQLEVVDYQKSNFIHADLSPEGMKQAMKDRGEDETIVFIKVFLELMEKMQRAREDADKPAPPVPTFGLEDLLDARKLKRLLADQLVGAGGDAGFGRTINRSLIDDRNEACMKVLKQQLGAGKKRIAIFYGAAHMPDFDKRLKEIGMKRVSSEWFNAWNL